MRWYRHSRFVHGTLTHFVSVIVINSVIFTNEYVDLRMGDVVKLTTQKIMPKIHFPLNNNACRFHLTDTCSYHSEAAGFGHIHRSTFAYL